MADTPSPPAPPRISVRTQTLSGRLALAIGAGLIVTLLSLPFWASQGTIRSVVELCCYIAIAQMWNLLAGYAGLVSVGQQAFSGVAAYLTFVLAQNFGINPFVAIVCSLAAPALLAVPVYALLHRLDGPYFAIGTWVVAEVVRLIFTNLSYVNSGAGMSLRVMTQYTALERNIAICILCALMLVATVGGSYLLLRSRYGLALTAMRDNPVSAASQGVNVGRLRFLIFVAAAVGTGLAGAIYFSSQLRITPSAAFSPEWASIAIFIVMIGGIGTIEGVLVGALIYYFAHQWFGAYGASYLIVLGILTMVVALYLRGGLWGFFSRFVEIPWFPTRRKLEPRP